MNKIKQFLCQHHNISPVTGLRNNMLNWRCLDCKKEFHIPLWELENAEESVKDHVESALWMPRWWSAVLGLVKHA